MSFWLDHANGKSKVAIRGLGRLTQQCPTHSQHRQFDIRPARRSPTAAECRPHSSRKPI